MRCWAIGIELGGREFEIPALPAVDWWPVLASGDLGMVLDLIPSSPDDPASVDELLLSGTVSAGELEQALTDAVEEAAGRSLHAAIVLASLANARWADIGGDLARDQFRWDKRPLGAALDAVYNVVMSRMEDKGDRDRFLALLDNEGLTSGKPSPRQRARAEAEFETMAGPKPTTGVVATAERSGSERPRTRPRPRPPRRAARSASPTRLRAPRAGSDQGASS
jgi:hypothetical protein